MAKIFSFRGDLVIDLRPHEAVFTYIPHSDVESSDIERNLVSILDCGKISPDWLIYISPSKCAKPVHDKLISELLAERFKNLSRAKGICLATFDCSGKIYEPSWIRHGGEIVLPCGDAILFAARNAGLECLIERDGVVTMAPPGAYFRNPSQSPRSYFIRTALLCRNSVEASFVAFTLLPLLARAAAIYGRSPNLIWVDTVSIAYIAYALKDLSIELDGLTSEPEIRSHSSYKGVSATCPEIGQFPVFLISASTSGSLARDLVSKSEGRIKPETICTMLGAFCSPYPELLYSIPESKRGPDVKSIDTLREILVSGEDFLFNPGEPLAVVLKSTHLPKDFVSSFEKIRGKNLIHYFSRSRSSKIKTFFIDGDALRSDDAFKRWIESKATGSLPASIKTIIFQNDESSRQMAEIVFNAISPFYAASKAPEVVSISDIQRRPPQNDETVAVVAAVAGSGMELMNITKTLRTYQPDGSRYFLLGVVLARSYAQLAQLKSNLKRSDDGLTYAVDIWREYAPSAEAICQYRQREIDLFKKIADSQPFDSELVDIVAARLKTLQIVGLLHESAPKREPFLSLTGRDDAFDVGDGFALWSKGGNRRCPADVLFTVACWLQNARECKSLPNAERLDGGGFQQAVIAPDCFLRFTDPVIQVSILRSAHDSELDYRSSLKLSARAAEIIIKLIRVKEESAVEFLVALSVGRLQLRAPDKKQIIEEISAPTTSPLIQKIAFEYKAAD